MGPRRYRRGWSSCGPLVPRRAGFNGAATLSSRMARCERYPRPRTRASMGPRRYRRGWDSASWGLLSWPSCFNGAATLSSRMGNPRRYTSRRRSQLQWGRDVIVADGSMDYDARAWTDLLQWGRDVIVADGWGCHSSVGSCSCFNGAATLSSRMGKRPWTPLPHSRASMGPRRYRRGW